MTSGRWRGPGWRLFDTDPACGKTVRDWIARIISVHACPVDPEDAALVVSELFGNAVVHGPDKGQVLVGYVLWSDGARIVVCDGGGSTLPQLRGSSELAEGGRGLHVVDALAARWGSFRAGQAQVVWCDLGQPMHAAAGEAWAWLSAVLAKFTLVIGSDEDCIAVPGGAMGSVPRTYSCKERRGHMLAAPAGRTGHWCCWFAVTGNASRQRTRPPSRPRRSSGGYPTEAAMTRIARRHPLRRAWLKIKPRAWCGSGACGSWPEPGRRP